MLVMFFAVLHVAPPSVETTTWTTALTLNEQVLWTNCWLSTSQPATMTELFMTTQGSSGMLAT